MLQRVDFDVQIKLENGLAEFLTTRQQSYHTRPHAPHLTASQLCSPTPLRVRAVCVSVHFTEQLQPLSQTEFNRVLEGELDKLYTSAQPFPTFPESVASLYRRLQSTLVAILSTSPHHTIVLVTHGYGVQVLSEYMDPDHLITSTDFACITVARAWRRQGGEVGHAGRVPEQFEHSALVPEPLESEWNFECEQVCDVKHWRPDMEQDETTHAEKRDEAEQKLANPLPQEEEVKVADK